MKKHSLLTAMLAAALLLAATAGLTSALTDGATLEIYAASDVSGLGHSSKEVRLGAGRAVGLSTSRSSRFDQSALEGPCSLGLIVTTDERPADDLAITACAGGWIGIDYYRRGPPLAASA